MAVAWRFEDRSEWYEVISRESCWTEVCRDDFDTWKADETVVESDETKEQHSRKSTRLFRWSKTIATYYNILQHHRNHRHILSSQVLSSHCPLGPVDARDGNGRTKVLYVCPVATGLGAENWVSADADACRHADNRLSHAESTSSTQNLLSGSN